ncbi:TrkH family potassium uptake protein [Desmospora profundinema]|uniref:Trk system potassium uptake protein TrkH n=1 Tax=Desmospora profundinema TaxID=1571184 RepID=A0ABU1IQN2_9BACL|nr:TrkH family potassium uptake protein [Desmospora profundinema]MDR6226852.1 trk system potassium uptake protein TrkH [Desmospora profundinema]
MSRFDDAFQKITAAQALVLGFAILILIGTGLLSLPIATETGEPLPVLDALFTATSAVCVTGLVVVDTGSTFSTFGESVIMALIQVGGLGFMTFGVLFALLLGKKIGIKERLIIQQSFHQIKLQGLVKLVLLVLAITLIIESVGFTLLAIRWIPEWGWGEGLYLALFHTISAFNNAGFDLFGDSLIGYVGDPIVNLTITSLFILGGIGFVVIAEVLQYRSTKRLSLHTKLVLSVTGGLIVLGTLTILAIEWTNPETLAAMPLETKLLASFFQGVTPRTAGFSTLDIADMYPATQFFIILLMFIGASPSSTGGGIKTTTFIIVLLAVWAMVRGKSDVVSFKRRVPHDQVYRALAVLVVALSLIMIVTIFLTMTEHTDLMTSLFETVSAAGTVGLSLGLTSELTPLGKLLITITMFAGRLGPMTLAFAIARRIEKENIRYPEEKPLIG